ncbi:ribonuclease P protein component 1 [Methanobacterium aggregans]|uniref:ribonuclease P protein component 1 n=1 Tax=Methanobacterium aggregans TaxID=1615586 RepID=UPI001AE3924B|nr:ribonuclease P protein component 1 [Methanobacterium aggregans]MBP2044903.1 ribonuclease P protein subunit POP4 [Methanobacterium aggregans]
MITPQNIFQHEFIGLHVEVKESSHEGFIGINGKVVDETRNTITVETDDGVEKLVPKKASTFRFKLPEGAMVEIDGSVIVARPEDRIKKKFRKYW